MTHTRHKPLILVSQAGCLLPTFIIFNLLFGWIFFKPVIWLTIEGALIVLFAINAYIFTRRILGSPLRRNDAIDVEAQVVKEKGKLR